ncbi:haloacid dehalogenase type II [Algoriphagus aquimarinus]|uniref:Haloacid dehalogenase type II n=1 Tax=Algoriphagus aquimarinus TaxID=237018 RepID=A0A5C7B2A2_9BACT|nr:haloacid dehalogenase type II [Algoriphagus aquimarinus]TXE14103.1 haloacid dehalogenase type II [Algoriphagus aquimarinus]
MEHSFAFDTWFALLLQYAWVESLSENYRPFGEIADATLKMTAEKLDRKITQSEIKFLLSIIKTLPPHGDEIEGMAKLKEVDIPMVALTNGSLDVANAQMEFSGLIKFLERVFSVEEVGYFKPHPSRYLYVLKEMGYSAKDTMLVACHPWDLLGAKRAGLQTCLIKREGVPDYPYSEPFDLEVHNLKEVPKNFKN